jgi:hypothetical protein
VLARSKNLRCRDVAQFLQGLVPEQDPMVLSDHEGGDRGALQDAVETLFALPQGLLGRLSLRDVFEGLHGAHEGAL